MSWTTIRVSLEKRGYESCWKTSPRRTRDLKETTYKQKRLKGIEPSLKAWEAVVLPLHHSRIELV